MSAIFFSQPKQLNLVLSLTCPYGQLYNTGTSLRPIRTVRLVPEMPKIILNIPYLYNTVTWFCPFGVRVKEV